MSSASPSDINTAMYTHSILISLVDMETRQLNIQHKHLSAKENKSFQTIKKYSANFIR